MGVLSHFSNPVKHLLIDSRLLIEGEGTLFFAIRSATNDGHRYIDELMDKGVKCFIVDDKFEIGDRVEGAEFLVVDDVVKELQAVASEHRNEFDIDIVAITGSNGKTIVKEWLKTALSDSLKVVATPKSYNSQIGVPLSLWQIADDHQIGIFEAGISRKGEMEALARMIKPRYGVFTHLGDAHNEGFDSREEKVIEKLKLFEGCEWLVVGDRFVADVIGKTGIYQGGMFTYGESTDDTLQVLRSETAGNQMEMSLIDNRVNERFDICVPFTDKASLENVLSVISMMLVLGYDKSKIVLEVGKLDKIEMRLEVKEGINDCVIINDSYSFDVDSLVIAVDYLSNNYVGMSKSMIISDMVGVGENGDKIYGDIRRLIERRGIDKVVLIGDEITGYFTDCKDLSISCFTTVEDFVNSTVITEFNKEVILVKGARSFHFESIVRLLENRNHGTILDVNLSALVHNFKYYRGLVAPNVKVAAMVKAFGYGAGSYEVARTLRFHNVDYLIVAYSDEGRELRQAGVDLPIMVMNPEDMDFKAMMEWNLEPEIYSLKTLNRLLREVSDNGDKLVKIHIKLDTGMHRLGFVESEIEELVNRIVACPNVKIASVFSHLAASDNGRYDDFTMQQIDSFKRIAGYITDKFDYKILLHIANTSAISRFPEAHFDMVRLGIGLYGVSNDVDEMVNLRKVSSLKSFICQIKSVKRGDSVGYNRMAIMDRDSVIGVVPIGYADGYIRMFGNGVGEMYVNGHIVPTVGNICMDMCMIDVTDIDCKEGDEVEIFGDRITVDSLAQRIGTIPYEILTNVSRRVKRVYFNE